MVGNGKGKVGVEVGIESDRRRDRGLLSGREYL